MKYNFDEIIPRKDTNSLKYDYAKKRGLPQDLIPLWVADMDFKSPQPVVDALIEKSKHGIFGYSDSMDDYNQVLENWFSSQYSWTISPKWLVKTPGVVFAINMAIHAYTEENDNILIQEPVYYPFRDSIEKNNRNVVVNELIYTTEGSYVIDFDDFERKILQHHVKLFILSNPHNPVGRVFTQDELIQLGNICLKHNVLLVADEIHQDFIYPGYHHTVFAGINDAFAQISITCTSPSKTFNLAGLQLSNVFIPNTSLRKKFIKALTRSGYSQPNVMGLVSCQAAYEHGHEWLTQLNHYLYENLIFTRDFLKTHLPKLHLIEPEGTYLIWIDFSSLGLSDEEIKQKMLYDAKVWLDDGTMFGQGGFGFQRINIACPRAILEQALRQIAKTFSD
jgi:cystathionine beta-lyase